MEYNYEAGARIRAGFIGAGGHSYRNIYPCFQYAPVELVALADHHAEKAAAFSRLFGAERWYLTHEELLANERLDAVFICTSFDAEGKPRYPGLAIEAMRAGMHVWIEKPAAETTAEIDAMRRASEQTGKHVAVGYKKMFFPAYARIKELVESPAFGPVSSASMRYRLTMPPPEKRDDTNAWKGFMDICHPASALYHILGPAEELVFRRSPAGDVSAVLTFPGGVACSLHLAGRQANTSPLERLEVVGQGANAVADNCASLVVYRRGGERGPGGYGRTTSFIGPDENAPLYWEPEFSLGNLYNKGLFLEGYVQQVDYFARCILDGVAPEIGDLDDAWHLTRLFEAFRYGPEGQSILLSEFQPPARG
jgi:predicted dehydrogenase